MNCMSVQQEITESFAAGEFRVSSEVSAHVKCCAVCRDFMKNEQVLFGSMDAGLQVLVNPQIPTSLIPGVRARLEEQPSIRHTWSPGWRFTLFAAASVLAVSFLFTWHQPSRRPPNLEGAQVSPPGPARPLLVPRPAEGVKTSRSSRSARRPSTRIAHGEASEAVPVVIVLAEEREAFARFVAQLPKEKDVALALTHPAPAMSDQPVEIALLEIGNMELKPLDASTRE